jgi:hypothetical protein
MPRTRAYFGRIWAYGSGRPILFVPFDPQRQSKLSPEISLETFVISVKELAGANADLSWLPKRPVQDAYDFADLLSSCLPGILLGTTYGLPDAVQPRIIVDAVKDRALEILDEMAQRPRAQRWNDTDEVRSRIKPLFDNIGRVSDLWDSLLSQGLPSPRECFRRIPGGMSPENFEVGAVGEPDVWIRGALWNVNAWAGHGSSHLTRVQVHRAIGGALDSVIKTRDAAGLGVINRAIVDGLSTIDCLHAVGYRPDFRIHDEMRQIIDPLRRGEIVTQSPLLAAVFFDALSPAGRDRSVEAPAFKRVEEVAVLIRNVTGPRSQRDMASAVDAIRQYRADLPSSQSVSPSTVAVGEDALDLELLISSAVASVAAAQLFADARGDFRESPNRGAAVELAALGDDLAVAARGIYADTPLTPGTVNEIRMLGQ